MSKDSKSEKLGRGRRSKRKTLKAMEGSDYHFGNEEVDKCIKENIAAERIPKKRLSKAVYGTSIPDKHKKEMQELSLQELRKGSLSDVDVLNMDRKDQPLIGVDRQGAVTSASELESGNNAESKGKAVAEEKIDEVGHSVMSAEISISQLDQNIEGKEVNNGVPSLSNRLESEVKSGTSEDINIRSPELQQITQNNNEQNNTNNVTQQTKQGTQGFIALHEHADFLSREQKKNKDSINNDTQQYSHIDTQTKNHPKPSGSFILRHEEDTRNQKNAQTILSNFTATQAQTTQITEQKGTDYNDRNNQTQHSFSETTQNQYPQYPAQHQKTDLGTDRENGGYQNFSQMYPPQLGSVRDNQAMYARDSSSRFGQIGGYQAHGNQTISAVSAHSSSSYQSGYNSGRDSQVSFQPSHQYQHQFQRQFPSANQARGYSESGTTGLGQAMNNFQSGGFLEQLESYGNGSEGIRFDQHNEVRSYRTRFDGNNTRINHYYDGSQIDSHVQSDMNQDFTSRGNRWQVTSNSSNFDRSLNNATNMNCDSQGSDGNSIRVLGRISNDGRLLPISNEEKDNVASSVSEYQVIGEVSRTGQIVQQGLDTSNTHMLVSQSTESETPKESGSVQDSSRCGGATSGQVNNGAIAQTKDTDLGSVAVAISSAMVMDEGYSEDMITDAVDDNLSSQPTDPYCANADSGSQQQNYSLCSGSSGMNELMETCDDECSPSGGARKNIKTTTKKFETGKGHGNKGKRKADHKNKVKKRKHSSSDENGDSQNISSRNEDTASTKEVHPLVSKIEKMVVRCGETLKIGQSSSTEEQVSKNTENIDSLIRMMEGLHIVMQERLTIEQKKQLENDLVWSVDSLLELTSERSTPLARLKVIIRALYSSIELIGHSAMGKGKKGKRVARGARWEMMLECAKKLGLAEGRYIEAVNAVCRQKTREFSSHDKTSDLESSDFEEESDKED